MAAAAPRAAVTAQVEDVGRVARGAQPLADVTPRARVVVCTRAASHTVPTGFSGVPPPGPAIPVTAMVQSAENSRCAPSAIARTVASETAPYASRVSSGTLSAAVLITSAYATTPPMKVSDAPGMLVIRSPIIPPVHDSATPNR